MAIMGQRPLLLNEWARLNSMGNKQLLLFFPLKERKTQNRIFNSLCLSSSSCFPGVSKEPGALLSLPGFGGMAPHPQCGGYSEHLTSPSSQSLHL